MSAIMQELGLLKGETIRGHAAIGLRLNGTFDQQHDRSAEQQQQLGRMQPKRLGLAYLGSHHHAGKADQEGYYSQNIEG